MAESNRRSVKITSSPARRKDLADEAVGWTNGRFAPAPWEDAPEAVLAKVESIAVSIRFPRAMLELLRAFAAREGIGYQVLVKRWLNDRIADEKVKILGQPAVEPRRAPRPDVVRVARPAAPSKARSGMAGADQGSKRAAQGPAARAAKRR